MTKTTFAELYKEHYIIYFDILGYKAFFEKCDSIKKLEDYHEKITQGIEIIINDIQEQNRYFGPSPDRFAYRIFSDNICIFIESRNDKYDLLKFMQIINLSSRIQRFFLFSLGLLIRGCITKGKIIDDDKCIFGDGLIDAVTLESQAIYPRIYIPNAKVIGPLLNISLSVACNCRNAVDIITYKLFLEIYNCLIEENEQFFYLDYLRDFDIKQFLTDDIKNKMIEFSKETNSEMAKILEKTKNQKVILYPTKSVILHFRSIMNILLEYSNYHYDGNDNNTRKIVEKIVWVLKYHNKVCDRAKLRKFHIKYHVTKDKDNKIKDFTLKTKLEDITG